MDMQKLTEELAAKEHESWARWMSYLFSKCEAQPDGSMLIPSELVARWQEEVNTPYTSLPEPQKQSDRKEVFHILPIIKAEAIRVQGNANASSLITGSDNIII